MLVSMQFRDLITKGGVGTKTGGLLYTRFPAASSGARLCTTSMHSQDQVQNDRQRAMLSDSEAWFPDLLPGIPNEVTLNQITTKLSWRDFYILKSVSRTWCHAIRSRQVYSARVLCCSTETLILLNYARSSECNHLALYSMRDNSCCDLPLIPDVAVGFPQLCQSVSLDGKIYVLGGGFSGSRKVYVLDLLGQRQWKQCASMIQRRVEFGCHVMNGNFYVFGGCVGFDSGSEVYDPKENTWSQIRPMITPYPSYHVEIVGEEFWVWNSEYNTRRNADYPTMGIDRGNIEVYNPAKDEWREIPWSQTYTGCSLVFMAQGKLHDMCFDISIGAEFGITVHNAGENSWTHLHSCTFASNGLGDFTLPMAVLEVNDELLAVVFWCARDYETHKHREGYCLVRSTELGSTTEEIRWQEALELTGSLKGIVPENDFPDSFSMLSLEL